MEGEEKPEDKNFSSNKVGSHLSKYDNSSEMEEEFYGEEEAKDY